MTLSFALKNLLRRPVRTLLSVTGIAVAIASFVALTAIASGFKKSLDVYATQTGARLLAYDRTVPDPFWSRLTDEDIAALRTVPGVTDVATSSAMPAIIEGMPAILILGRYPGERLMRFYERQLVTGRVLRLEDEAMLGSVAAQQTGKKVGDSVFVLGTPFTIVGIYETRVPFENGGMVVHGNVFRRGQQRGFAGQVAFLYLDGSSDDAVTREVRRRLPRLRLVSAAQVSGQFDQVQYVDSFVWVISVAALLVGAIGVLNTLLMAVSERIREIGTLRAVGWSRLQVMRLIWAEGVALSVAGGMVGLALGVAAAELLVRTIPQGYVGTEYTPALFAEGLVVALVVGWIGSVYPALWASRLTPAAALRHE